MRTTINFLTLSLTIFLWSASAIGQSENTDNFYAGKTIDLLIGHSPGGGYDAYARTLARHIGKHIPGNPDIVPKNVTGAGSLVLMNQVANTLPNDGTVFATVNQGMAFEPLLGNDQAKYRAADIVWLGSLSKGTSLCVSNKDAEVQSWQDLKSKTLTVGASGAGASTNIYPRVMAELFDFKFNIVTGYPGGNDILLAMERGEVEGRCSWLLSSARTQRPGWIEDRDVNVLFQMALEKHPDLPDVPLVMDFAETDKQTKVLRLFLARQLVARPYIMPPGVPEERVAIMRKAMADTAKDPEFLADAANQSLSIDFVTGEEAQAIVVETYEYPDDVVDVVKRAM
ncbi:MAG: tripartite tricarboxylate transporter substrate-binding protein [Marinobacter sp.]|uniref:Bug family tripartite tricarboxylate transporter substrate binding protein n=1 Tax=Marinobacter sp. TaxID=50741 RepID=UPI0034A053EF